MFRIDDRDSKVLNQLESSVLYEFLKNHNLSFHWQSNDLANVRVASREFTGVGFFTNFNSDGFMLRGDNLNSGEHILTGVDGLLDKTFVGFILYVDNYKLVTLEGHVFGSEDWPQSYKSFAVVDEDESYRIVNHSHDMSALLGFYQSVEKLIFEEWDPLGINQIDSDKDEYIGYTVDIIRNLKSASSIRDVTEFLSNIATEKLSVDCNKEQTEKVAEKLLSLKNKCGKLVDFS